MKTEYPVISDWSKEGRETLVDANRELFTTLLYRAFSSIADRYGEQPLLDAFRWGTLDDAVEWCLNRFTTAKLDPAQLTPPLRTWKLFTVPGFWLAQREGRAGYARKVAALKAAQARPAPSSSEPGRVDADEPVDLDVKRLVIAWVNTLRQLLACTCPSLITWWLRATERLRADWFDVPVPELAAEPASKSERSKRAHDALLRFQGLHQGLVQEGTSVEPAHMAMREWLFRPCEDEPPYRRSEAQIAAALPESLPRDKRAIQKLRREGVEALISRLVERAGNVPGCEDEVASAEWQLLRMSVTKTTLTAFKLDEGARPELERQIEQLAALQIKGRGEP